MSFIQDKKTFFRRGLLAKRESFSEEYRRSASEEMVRRIAEMQAYRDASLLLCYYAVRTEVDLRSLYEKAISDGKRLAFPRCEGKRLCFYYIENPNAMQEGSFSIPEPSGNELRVENLEQALCLVPALSADKQGYRLGYGGGYYDRFLAENDVLSVTAVFEKMRLESIVHESFDQRVDIVITEEREINCHEA